MYQDYLEISLQDGWYASVTLLHKPLSMYEQPARLVVGSAVITHDLYETTFHMDLWMHEYDRHSKQYRIYVDTYAKDFEGEIVQDTYVTPAFFFHGPSSDAFLCEKLARHWEAQHAEWIAGANALRLARPVWEMKENAS